MLTINFTKKQLQIVLCHSQKNIKVKASYVIDVPDGFIVNGMIQNEAEFGPWLKEIVDKYNLKGKKTTAILDSTVIVYRELTTPNLSKKALKKFVYYNMSQQVSNMQENIVDYAVLSQPNANELKILTIFVPQNMVDVYNRVLKVAGLKPHHFTTRALGLFRSTQLIESNVSTRILAYSSNDIVNAVLISNGQFVYCNVYRYDEQVQSIESALNERISQMMQFQKIKNPDEPVQQITIGSMSLESMDIAEKLTATLGIPVDVFQKENQIIMSELSDKVPFYLICPAIYANIKTHYKDYNLFQGIDQKIYGDVAKNKKKNSLLVTLLISNLILVGGISTYKLFEHHNLVQGYKQLELTWNDSALADKYAQTNELLSDNVSLREVESEFNVVTKKIKSESRFTLDMYDELITLKPADVVIVEIENENGSEIIFECLAKNRVSPFTYVSNIRATSVYQNIVYQGFVVNEATGLYAFSFTLITKAGEQ